MEAFYLANFDVPRQSTVITDDPGPLGDPAFDVFVAAVGEHLLQPWSLPVPAWMSGVSKANNFCLKIEQCVLCGSGHADLRGASMDEYSYSEKALSADLRAWWDGEVSGEDDPFADPKAASGTIFDVLPAIDSLGCIDGLLTIEKHVGFEVPSRILRRGGYSSFEDMASDLLPKVRAMVERRQTPRGKEAA